MPLWSQVGLTARVDRQGSPVLHLLEADAAGLAVREPVSVRGENYLVSSPPERLQNGLVRIELMPDNADAQSPGEGERWR